MIRPGLCSVTFRALSARDVIALAVENGVQAIEWGGDRHVPPGDTDLARDVGRACAAQGIAPASYGSYVRAGSPDARAEFTSVLASAAALGAGNIRVWAGTANRATAGDAALRQTARDLAAMADAAAAKNITVSVEFHRNTLTETAADAVALFSAANADNLFSYWQPVPGRGLAQWQAELDMLAPWLGDLHVFHWIRQNDADQRRPLEEGVADWRDIMASVLGRVRNHAQNDAQKNTRHHAGSPDRWPHPKTAFLEFVRGDAVDQFRNDMRHLRTLCGGTKATGEK